MLTYMLTRDAIKAAIKDGRLIAAKPIVPWAGEPRAFLMCRPLYGVIVAGRASSSEAAVKRWARLEADISHFIEGGLITENLLKHLKPEKYEHWILRSRKPRPSLRVFGRFAEPNVFVGTHVVRRDQLKGMWSEEFEHEKLVCEQHWMAAKLPAPFSASTYEEYMTENAVRRMGGPK